MALLSPQQLRKVQTALSPAPTEKPELSGLLEEKGLSVPEILSRVEFEMLNGETGSVRVRAAEMALKLNGLLQRDEAQAQSVSVNILIQDSEFGSINPILIPR